MKKGNDDLERFSIRLPHQSLFVADPGHPCRWLGRRRSWRSPSSWRCARRGSASAPSSHAASCPTWKYSLLKSFSISVRSVSYFQLSFLYIVILVFQQLGWVDLDWGSSSGSWAATLPTGWPQTLLLNQREESLMIRWVTLYITAHEDWWDIQNLNQPTGIIL